MCEMRARSVRRMLSAMAEIPATENQFRSALAVLSGLLDTYERALTEAKRHTEHTDALRAHLAGARWMFATVFGKDEGYRLDEAAEKKTGFELPPMGPRVDGDKPRG
jgi:hypothetical protein